MRTFSLAAVCLAAALQLLPTTAMAQRDFEGRAFDERGFYDDRRGGAWNRLGEIVVRPRVERELIRVNPRGEAFSRIGLRAFDGDIEVVELNIRYANNEIERIRVNRVIRAGTGVPPIDLSGRARRVREIEVVYRPFGPARLEVVGREGGPGPGADLAVRTVIPEGAETRPIDLSGRFRGIDRIELYYLPQITFGGRANVCAFGL